MLFGEICYRFITNGGLKDPDFLKYNSGLLTKTLSLKEWFWVRHCKRKYTIYPSKVFVANRMKCRDNSYSKSYNIWFGYCKEYVLPKLLTNGLNICCFKINIYHILHKTYKFPFKKVLFQII